MKDPLFSKLKKAHPLAIAAAGVFSIVCVIIVYAALSGTRVSDLSPASVGLVAIALFGIPFAFWAASLYQPIPRRPDQHQKASHEVPAGDVATT